MCAHVPRARETAAGLTDFDDSALIFHARAQIIYDFAEDLRIIVNLVEYTSNGINLTVFND